MSKKDHIHKLKRHKYKNGEEVYFCVNDCKFKCITPLALGKTVECWKCGKPFEMNTYSIRLDRPRCNDCVEHKNPTTKFKGVSNEKDPIDSLKARLAGISIGDIKEDLL